MSRIIHSFIESVRDKAQDVLGITISKSSTKKYCYDHWLLKDLPRDPDEQEIEDFVQYLRTRERSPTEVNSETEKEEKDDRYLMLLTNFSERSFCFDSLDEARKYSIRHPDVVEKERVKEIRKVDPQFSEEEFFSRYECVKYEDKPAGSTDLFKEAIFKRAVKGLPLPREMTTSSQERQFRLVHVRDLKSRKSLHGVKLVGIKKRL